MGSNAQTQLRSVPMTGPMTTTDVKLTLPARPENVSVIRHVLGAFAEALRLPGPGRDHDRPVGGAGERRGRRLRPRDRHELRHDRSWTGPPADRRDRR